MASGGNGEEFPDEGARVVPEGVVDGQERKLSVSLFAQTTAKTTNWRTSGVQSEGE